MPKHALAPTREKSSGVKESSDVQVSNEVLLRSKIAQLEGKRNRNGPKKTLAASGGRGGGGGGKSGKKGAKKGNSRNATEGGDSVGGGGTGTALPKNEMDILMRFDQKLAELMQLKAFDAEDSSAGAQEGQNKRRGFTPKGMQVLREMYQEQIRTARTMNRHADVLNLKIRDLAASNKLMRAESDDCAREAARLEHAESKLHALTVGLEGRKRLVLENQKVATIEDLKRRKEMNATLAAMVNEISEKMKQQKEEKIAQCAENDSLRQQIEDLLTKHTEESNASLKAREAQEEEIKAIIERLEILTVANVQSLEAEEELKKDLEETVAQEEALMRRIGENSSRLRNLDPALNAQLKSIQQMQGEDGGLTDSLKSLLREKYVMLSRLGIEDEVGSSGHGEGEEVGKGGGRSDFTGDRPRALVREREERAAELKMEKERLETRCRDLQMERQAVAAEVYALQTEEVAEAEEDSASSCNGACHAAESSS